MKGWGPRAAILLVAAVLSPAAARGGDAAAGKAKAAMCAVCHGELGLSQAPDAPHLAGQPEVYLVQQLKAYRSGKRQHEVMSVMAKQLSDADIDNLAAWYSSIAVHAEPPKK
ncbi:MAG TPA: cytochrome c [Anaeromyxobacteraceae bacterium]|nr:cytochrome c [Anaeromyxobacteraceae bacterium]